MFVFRVHRPQLNWKEKKKSVWTTEWAKGGKREEGREQSQRRANVRLMAAVETADDSKSHTLKRQSTFPRFPHPKNPTQSHPATWCPISSTTLPSQNGCTLLLAPTRISSKFQFAPYTWHAAVLLSPVTRGNWMMFANLLAVGRHLLITVLHEMFGEKRWRANLHSNLIPQTTFKFNSNILFLVLFNNSF